MIVQQGRQHFIADARDADRLTYEDLLEERSTLIYSADGKKIILKSDVGFSTSNFSYPFSGPFTLNEMRVEMSRNNDWMKLEDESDGGTF